MTCEPFNTPEGASGPTDGWEQRSASLCSMMFPPRAPGIGPGMYGPHTRCGTAERHIVVHGNLTSPAQSTIGMSDLQLRVKVLGGRLGRPQSLQCTADVHPQHLGSICPCSAFRSLDANTTIFGIALWALAQALLFFSGCRHGQAGIMDLCAGLDVFTGKNAHGIETKRNKQGRTRR